MTLQRTALITGASGGLGDALARVFARQGYKALMAGKRVFIPGWTNQLQALSARLLPRRAVTRVGMALMQPVGPKKRA